MLNLFFQISLSDVWATTHKVTLSTHGTLSFWIIFTQDYIIASCGHFPELFSIITDTVIVMDSAASL